jgi:hypothetical protein
MILIMKRIAKLALWVLISAIIVLVPLLFIWSLNTLFPALAIEYSFRTWVAAAFIMSIFGSQAAVLNK